MQNHLSHIAVIHQNSLCSLAMRTILNDIMPFMSAMGCVEIVSFNNIEEITEKYRNKIFLYFVSGDIVCENLQFFSQIARRCIVLNEGEDFIYKEFKHINTLLPEHELIKNLLMIHNHTHHSHSPHHHAEKPKEESLSLREKEVLELIVKGYINKEIADKLNISTSTVVFHRKNICERVGSKSIGRLTIYAVMNGIVDLREL